MKTMREAMATLVLLGAAAVPAWAVDSTTTYNSGILVLLFVGLCALVVVAQFAPVTMLLIGMAKSLAELVSRKRVEQEREEVSKS